MSFSSLKKSTHSVRPKLVTVDQFIDDAVLYANGAQTARAPLQVVQPSAKQPPALMKRATFTLNEATLNTLSELAAETGISKSRILRILVQEHHQDNKHSLLLDSELK